MLSYLFLHGKTIIFPCINQLNQKHQWRYKTAANNACILYYAPSPTTNKGTYFYFFTPMRHKQLKINISESINTLKDNTSSVKPPPVTPFTLASTNHIDGRK